MTDDLRGKGKVPVRRERLTIDEFEDWDNKLVISGKVAEVIEVKGDVGDE